VITFRLRDLLAADFLSVTWLAQVTYYDNNNNNNNQDNVYGAVIMT